MAGLCPAFSFMAVAVIAFAVVLALIASERVHRTKVAMLGAAIVVLFVGNAYGQQLAISSIDFNTIGLLAGMMILVHLTRATGVYDYIAIRAGQISKGRPVYVVLCLAGTTAVLSAFLDNLTTILLVVPITFLLADALDLDPVPLIVIEVVSSNIGGTATLIGDPPNIIIAGATGLSFNDFLLNLAPVVLVTFAVVLPLMYLAYRKRLQIEPENRKVVMELDAASAIRDAAELKRTGTVLALTILAFFVHGPLGVEPATVALTGAAIGLLVTRQDLEESLAAIEWATLFFFLALFVMVGALVETGAIDHVATAIADLTNGDRSAELLGITWISGIGSGVIDNIPFTTAMVPVVQSLQGGSSDDAYWWALALGACFGGNLTVIAAAANVGATGLAERAGHSIGFLTFLRVGIPVTLISLAIASAYIAVRYIAL